MQNLTQSRIAAALAAAQQPEGERPWRLLLTKAPTTYAEVQSRIMCAEDPTFTRFSDADEATLHAEASRARVINDLARRDAYTAALSASEQMISTTPVMPTTIMIRMPEWARTGPSIQWCFHRDATAVHAFAQHFGVPVVASPHGDEGTTTHVSAVGAVDGIQFEAYTLVDAAPEQVTA
ncbi:hypothetical protein OG244_19600 [Streptomyces brevispora]|uniref:hypothetical protein n=1 Tax=Streptomyces brevispora TaxID=887462 RepID=UPI002E346C26|nr:hypothetical protein [Streptomyces brevispora]